MTFTASFGRKTDGSAITFYHADEQVNAAQDAHLLHTHQEMELYLCLCGDCDFIIEEGRYRLQPGTLIFTRPGELHGIGINRDCRYNRFYIRIPANYYHFLASPGASPLAFMSKGTHTALLGQEAAERAEELLYRMESLLCDIREDSEVAAADAFRQICALCRNAVSPEKETGVNLLHPVVRKAADYIHRNFTELRSVGQVAREVGVSSAYLSRLFRANLKTTVTAYLRFKRMEYARRLLREGEPLTEVCIRCGYGDYSYFIAEFRRENGVTPIRYQKAVNTRPQE